MSRIRSFTQVVAATAAAVGFAGLAHADPSLLNGTYQGADPQFAWTIATSCGPAGCNGTVASNQGWVSPITLTDGRWDFTVVKPDGNICDDGRFAPAVIRVSIDPVTLAGVVTNDSNGECPGENVVPRQFQLQQLN